MLHTINTHKNKTKYLTRKLTKANDLIKKLEELEHAKELLAMQTNTSQGSTTASKPEKQVLKRETIVMDALPKDARREGPITTEDLEKEDSTRLKKQRSEIRMTT